MGVNKRCLDHCIEWELAIAGLTGCHEKSCKKVGCSVRVQRSSVREQRRSDGAARLSRVQCVP
jgi:hypothetical protein